MKKNIIKNYIHNLKYYQSNCREDVISEIQIQKKHAEYKIGYTLYATSDIGKKRKKQEDSMIILEHPKNDKFKLIAVSDGVGGNYGGALTSNHIIKKITLWFESIDENLALNLEEIKYRLRSYLFDILDDLDFCFGAATLSAAIIGKYETLIVNIGDSRVYTFKNYKLTQQTRDDSEVQLLFEEKEIPSKELMRFHKKSNIITQAINYRKFSYSPHYKIISNDSYDKILAVSDGVSDCISEKQLETLIKESKNEELANNIIKLSKKNDSSIQNIINKLPSKEKEEALQLEELLEEDYNQIINGGKDNTTAVVYIRK